MSKQPTGINPFWQALIALVLMLILSPIGTMAGEQGDSFALVIVGIDFILFGWMIWGLYQGFARLSQNAFRGESPLRSGEYTKCPYCAEPIRKEAVLCRYCHQEIKR